MEKNFLFVNFGTLCTEILPLLYVFQSFSTHLMIMGHFQKYFNGLYFFSFQIELALGSLRRQLLLKEVWLEEPALDARLSTALESKWTPVLAVWPGLILDQVWSLSNFKVSHKVVREIWIKSHPFPCSWLPRWPLPTKGFLSWLCASRWHRLSQCHSRTLPRNQVVLRQVKRPKFGLNLVKS